MNEDRLQYLSLSVPLICLTLTRRACCIAEYLLMRGSSWEASWSRMSKRLFDGWGNQCELAVTFRHLRTSSKECRKLWNKIVTIILNIIGSLGTSQIYIGRKKIWRIWSSKPIRNFSIQTNQPMKQLDEIIMRRGNKFGQMNRCGHSIASQCEEC